MNAVRAASAPQSRGLRDELAGRHDHDWGGLVPAVARRCGRVRVAHLAGAGAATVSRHHQAQRWSTHSPKLRKVIAPLLPLRCLDCPHPVSPDDKWQVGHRQGAADGGPPTLANTGPSHSWCPYCKRACNQSAGGKRGAKVTNAQRRRRSNSSKGLREW